MDSMKTDVNLVKHHIKGGIEVNDEAAGRTTNEVSSSWSQGVAKGLEMALELIERFTEEEDPNEGREDDYPLEVFNPNE